MTSADLVELIGILREHRVARYTGEVLIEFHPSAFGQPATQTEVAPDENCTCGHPLHDHNQSGCVLGCDLETCGRAESE